MIEVSQIGDWVVRQRKPEEPGPHPLFLMLHGWTGNEDSMWVFASKLPQNAWLVAPRGLYDTPLGGYGWHHHNPKTWPWVEDLRPTAEAVKTLLSSSQFAQADRSHIRWVGFSQGAALGFTFSLLYPEGVSAMAGLSGFLPDGYTALIGDHPLQDKPVFIAHGRRDTLVPVDKAREAAETLRQAGAQVYYCEEDVGHKLSAACFRDLQAFFQRY